jgi:endoglucanase
MRFYLVVIFTLIGAIGYCHAEPIELRRGVSIHEWLNWSPVRLSPVDRTVMMQGQSEVGSPYEWPPYQKKPAPITRSDLLRIRDQGFDFVRLSVDPGPLMSAGQDKRAEALAILGEAVGLVLDANLRVVIDFHPVSQVSAYSSKSLEERADQQLGDDYRRMLTQTAAMLRALVPDAPSRIALEVFNEPQFYPCDGPGGRRWQSTLERLVSAARAGAADLTLVVSGACGGNIKGLTNIDPKGLSDPNLLYSFHYYENLTFTHQGGKERPWLTSVPWPPSSTSLERTLALSRERLRSKSKLSAFERTAAEQEMRGQLEKYYREDQGGSTVEAAFARLLRWSETHSIPAKYLFMGEFGVIRGTARRPGADDADRLRWLSFVRKQAEKYGIGWSFWEYSNPHGMSLTTDTRTRAFDPVVLEALGLSELQ